MKRFQQKRPALISLGSPIQLIQGWTGINPKANFLASSLSLGVKVTLLGLLVTTQLHSVSWAQQPLDFGQIQTQIRLQDYDKAEPPLKRFLESDPRNEQARALLAELYEKANRTEDAITQRDILIEQHPGNLQYYYQKADMLTRLGQYEASLSTLNEAKAANEEDFFATSENSLVALTEANPDMQDARFLLARVFGSENKPVAAIEQYNKLIGLDPTNADYQLGKGLAYVRMEQYDNALEALNEAARISPNYEDVYRAQIRAYQLKGDYEKAVAVTNDAIEKFPDSTWPVPEKVAEAPTSESVPLDPTSDRPAKPGSDITYPYLDLEAGAGYNNLDNDFADWNNQYMLFRTELRPRLGFYGMIQGTERFDKYDTNFQIGTFLPVLPFLTYVGEFNYSPSGEIIPEYSFYNGAQVALPYGWVVSGGHRHSEYKTGIVETGVYGIEKYYRRYRLGYTMFQSYLHNAETKYAHLVSGNYYYGINNSNFGLGVTFGDEQQNILIPGSPLNVISVASVGMFFNGLHWFHPRWGVSYVATISDFDNTTTSSNLYTNIGFQLGLRHRF